MKEKKAIILSITSEIGLAIAMDLLKKKFSVIGTYNKKTKKLNDLKEKGVILYKLNLSDKKKIDQVGKKILTKSRN